MSYPKVKLDAVVDRLFQISADSRSTEKETKPRILVFRIGNDFGSRIQSGWENLSAPNQNGSHLTNAERRRTAGSLRGNSVLMFLYNSRS
ncbi:hypothetical protein B9Z55_015715 [Caenorhabditis nigoni]|uniref:Uncharacterized protein n=1 Tax=Caenorhabditis nigoni TaxID=1611254 RepID=A0A2G5UBE3_9PELO|nr:hypothetical protein B9Z55_015715 [Caenorhabditis nigoni]